MSSPFACPEVCVVEASAGSGKTYALAKRYIQLVLHGATQEPLVIKHILAITFTNKASGEMKGRIIELLKNIALGQLSAWQEEDMLKPIGLNAKLARPLANVIMQNIIHYYHFFSVKTIDSFMNALLSGCAFKINLSARFKIKRNSLDYLQLSLDELLDDANHDKRLFTLFEAFVRQYLYLENRSGWFPKKDLLNNLKALYAQSNKYQKSFLTFNGDVDIFVLKKKFLKIAHQLLEECPQLDSRFRLSLEGFCALHTDSFDIDAVSDFFKRLEIPVKKGSTDVGLKINRLWQEAGVLLNDICLYEAYALFNPYVEIFTASMGYMQNLQKLDDIVFLEELNAKARTLFDENLVTVEEIYYRLATRFHHYLMDEFQDTSLTQWENIRLMVEEALSTGGSLFYVGDKKQAIYAFRGGESLLFDALQKEFEPYVTHQNLERNFRSHDKIIHFNNKVFSKENLGHFMRAFEQESRMKDKDIAFNDDDFVAMQEVFGASHQIARSDLPDGIVKVQIIEGKKKEERHEMVRHLLIEQVKSAHKRFAWRDIGILTRNNTQVLEVTQWLLKEGIPAQSQRTSDIKAHPLIGELTSYLKFLHSPVNNNALADFVLGELFLKASGITSDEMHEFLFKCRIQKHHRAQTYIYKEFRLAYPEIWQKYFEAFLNQVGIYPLYELVISICAQFHCVELFPQAQAFLMHWFELIKVKEEDSCDLETFLNYFENLEDESRFVPMPQADALQVMTVHKSKGLEFGVVIIPFLEMSIKVGSGDRNGAQSYLWDIDDNGMRLLRLKDSYTSFSSDLKQRYAQEFKRAYFNELNTVYVALTRAVVEMYIYIPQRTSNSLNPATLLIPEELYVLGEHPMGIESLLKKSNHRDDSMRQMLPPISYQPWIMDLREEFEKSSMLTQARLQGEAVHFCLAQIKQAHLISVDEVVHQAMKVYPHIIQANEYCAYIQNLIQHPSMRVFFENNDAQIVCEQEVVNRFGHARRVDRLMILNDEVWVIDYKTSRANEEQHQQQIQEYADLIKQIYPNKKVKNFLIYLNELI